MSKAADNIKLFKTIFEQTPVSTQVFFPDGKTLMVNKAWEDLWNATFEQLEHYNVLKDQQLVDSGTMQYIKRGFKGEHVTMPAIYYDPTKTVRIEGLRPRWLSARMYPIKDGKGRITHLVLEHEDITDRKKFEESLRESEERLRIALDAGKIGVWDWDIKQNKLAWTDKVYEIHDVSPESFEVTLPNFKKLLHTDDKERVLQAIDLTIKQGTPFQIEFRINARDGSIRWVTTSAALLRDAKGKPQRLLGASLDITGQKLIDQEKSDFLSMAAHELKTPLTSLGMFVDLLSRKLTQTTLQKEKYFALKIKDQTNKLTELTNDLLDVTRIETGKLLLHKEKFDYAKLIREVIEGLQSTATQELAFTDNEKVTVLADKYRIYQVLVNLLTNAIKYSPADKKIDISVNRDSSSVVTCVKDYGIGITKSMHAKIFERLYQVTDTKERIYPGLGLGLYISKEIVERHAGKIWVESEKGKGASFYFSLPLDDRKQ